MTNKKRRQRGSRTHGGGSQKNRRGAGHRGGRGRAGRRKHERTQYGPRGKSGFKRPEAVQRDVREISIRQLDEDIVLYVADGLATENDEGHRIDARDALQDGHEADVLPSLG
jgi:large subunit ribosomal protein L15